MEVTLRVSKGRNYVGFLVEKQLFKEHLNQHLLLQRGDPQQQQLSPSPAPSPVCRMANATSESTVAQTQCGDICCSLCTARQLFTLHLLTPVRGFWRAPAEIFAARLGMCAALHAEKTPGISSSWKLWSLTFSCRLLAPEHFPEFSNPSYEV